MRRAQALHVEPPTPAVPPMGERWANDAAAADDLAFADTVLVPDLAGPPLPAFASTRWGAASDGAWPGAMLASPAPPASGRRRREPHARRLHGALERAAHGLRCSADEMSLLWSATAETHPRRSLGRRIGAFLAFFEWQRDDLLRAAWIGLAVLALVGTLASLALAG